MIKHYVEQYGVSEELLQQFIDQGMIENLSIDLEYKKDELIKKLNLCTCLYDLGLDVGTIKNYMKLEQVAYDSIKERIAILRKARVEMLQNMHDEKSALDCLDALIQALKSDMKISHE